jgi:hypothetical protein
MTLAEILEELTESPGDPSVPPASVALYVAFRRVSPWRLSMDGTVDGLVDTVAIPAPTG